MNNRILATLFALAIALFIGVAPVKAEAADACQSHDFDYTDRGDGRHNAVCDDCGFTQAQTHVVSNNTCTDCGAHIHNMTTVPAKEATCAEPGKNAYYYCSACQMNFLDADGKQEADWDTDIVIPVEEHNYGYGHDATTHWNECADCGFDEAGSGSEHDVSIWDTSVEGKHEGTCSVCEVVVVASENHDFAGSERTDNGDGTHSATCQECGYVKKVEHFDDNDDCKCDSCHVQLEHTLTDWYKYPSDPTKHIKYCTTCDKTILIEAHAYVYEAIDGDKHTVTCTVCGDVDAEEQCNDTADSTEPDHVCDLCEDPYIHVYAGAYMVNETGKSPKCEEDGIYLHKTCDVCGIIMKLDGTIVDEEGLVNPKTGHNLVWNHGPAGHYQVCEHETDNCDYQTDLEPHDADAYTSVEGTGTHIVDCATCGRGSTAYTESCVDEDADCICELCGGLMLHDKYGATMTYVEWVDATCTKDGHTDYYECSQCGNKFLSDGSVTDPAIDSPGHDWKYVGLTESGMHQQQCQVCWKFKSVNHIDENDDCYCDIEGCGILAHTHTPVYVAEVRATCTEPGTAGYYIYQDCGKLVSGEAPVELPALGHTWGDEWVVTEDTHAPKCTVCGEAGEAEDHVYNTRSVSCDVCGAVTGLTHHEANEATCTESGNVEYWYSNVTGKAYADAEGTVELDTPVILATGHNWAENVDLGNDRHGDKCMSCGDTKNAAYHVEGDYDCFCAVCGAGMKDHTIELIAMEPAECTKSGHQAYFKCSCGAMYDMGGNKLTVPVAIAAKGHKLTGNWIQDTRTGDHYQVCAICGDAVHADHAPVVENPRKGNYHQWVCECGKVETEVHYDNDGDNKCDECGHTMTSSSVEVEQHDSVTVITGNPDTINPHKSWWQNWLESLIPGNAGGTTSTAPTTSGSTTVTPDDSTSGGTVVTPEEDVSTSTNIISDFIQWLSQLFNVWVQGK